MQFITFFVIINTGGYMKKKWRLVILCFFVLICGILNIKGIAVDSDGKIGNTGLNIRDFRYIYDTSNTVETLCIYYDQAEHISQDSFFGSWKNTDKNDDNFKYLFIYKDGKASMGWYGYDWRSVFPQVNNRTFPYNSGEREILNWKKNYSNSEWQAKNISNNLDVYSDYKETGNCPLFLSQSQDWSNNYFYLASSITSFESAKAAIEEADGNTIRHYYLYATESDSSDSLTCEYTGGLTVNFKGGVFESFKLPLLYKINAEDIAENLMDFETLTIADAYVSSSMNAENVVAQRSDGKCPKSLYTCASQPGAFLSLIGNGAFSFFNPILGFNNGLQKLTEADLIIHGSEEYANCSDNQIVLSCIGDNCSEASVCDTVDQYENELKSKMDNYKNESDKILKQQLLSDYKDLRSRLQMVCSSMLSNLNYSEGGCIDRCLDLNKNLAFLETDAGIRNDANLDKCNLTSSIISYVYNILKYAKYIAPILAIILSILDFIKAIAASSEDEMKKAQGKFIKRLIVAALLFLVPLIINFLLQTFGVYNAECDIGKLFS